MIKTLLKNLFPQSTYLLFWEHENIQPGNKNAVVPNPLTKEESHRVYKCDGERLSGLTKLWIFKSMWNISHSRHIIFKIRPRVSHTGLLLWRNVTLNETNCDWLFDMSVKWAGPAHDSRLTRPFYLSPNLTELRAVPSIHPKWKKEMDLKGKCKQDHASLVIQSTKSHLNIRCKQGLCPHPDFLFYCIFSLNVTHQIKCYITQRTQEKISFIL